MPLVPCPACRRHHREGEAACPFCRSPSPLRGALLAGVTAAALGLAGCSSPDPGPAAVYGGPPPQTDGPPPDRAEPDPGPVAPMYGAPAEPPPPERR